METISTPSRLFVQILVLILFSGISGAVYATDPSDCPGDLMVLLKLDETSGPNYADVYGVHDAIAPNSPVPATGKINGCQLFNDNSKINIPDNGSEFDWSTDVSFSLECWIKTSQKKAQVAIGRYRTDAPETSVSWWFGLNGNGYATLEIKDNSNNNSVLSGTTNLADDQWHYIVATRNGATNHNKVYVDGVEVADMTVDLPGDFGCPLPTDVTVGYLLRGNDYAPEYHFNGLLDEIGIYTKALTATEITSFYNGGSPAGHCTSFTPPEITGECPSDLLFLLRLDETSGPDYADFYGVNNAIATNSPTAVTGIVNGGQLFNQNTRVNIPDNGSDFEWAAGCSFSLEFWIKTSVTGIAQVGVSRQIAGSGITWWLGLNEFGGAVMELKDHLGTNYAVYNKNLAVNYYEDNNWHHIVGVKDGVTGYIKLYADGVLVDEQHAVFNGNFIAPSPTDVSIGYMLRADGSSSEYHVRGVLDEVAVYTRALSAAEIVSFYNNGAPVCRCTQNDSLRITSTPVTEATEDITYTYNFTTIGKNADDTLTLSAITKPDWLNFNWTPGHKSAVLTGTPAHENIGENPVILKVTDGHTDVLQSFSIIVTGVNHVPVITGQNVLSINEDTPKTLSKSDLIITDIDNPPSDITIEVLAGSHYTFNGNQVTPEANFNGQLSVNVIAKDLIGQSSAYPVLITILPVNDMPVITTDPQLITDINDTYLYEMEVMDVDGDALTITAVSKPNWLTFTAGSYSATLTGIPTILGTYAVILRVNDGHTNVDQSFSINVAAINDLPVITGQNSLDVDEDHSITLTKSDLVITDEDNPSTDLTLHVLAGSHYTFNGNIITPDANYFGPLNVNAAVSDLVGQGPDYPLYITVNPVNDFPAITSDPVLTVKAKETYSYQMTVQDVDYNDVLTLSVVSKPDWLNFNWTPGQKSAILTGTPFNENAGSNNVTLRVNDGYTHVDQSFSINVVEVVNNIPVITGQVALAVNEDHPITIVKSNLHIDDADNTDAEISIQVLAGTNYSFIDNTVTPAPNYSGQLSVNVVAKDLLDQSEIYSVIIIVNPVNDLPVITSNPGLTIHANQLYIYQMTVEDEDEGDILTITASGKPDWLSFTPGLKSAIMSGIPASSDVGSYPILLKVNDGHEDVLQGFVLTVSGPTGVADMDNTMINSVYPNPAGDKIYFRLATTEPSQIEIYDLLGNLRMKVNVVDEDVFELNITDLSNGIYIFKIYQNGIISTGKFTRN